jgi:hypothetical protein
MKGGYMFKNLYVGVDLCEAEFSACFMDGNERNLASRKYPNTFEGFRLFRQDCLAFSRLVGRNASIIKRKIDEIMDTFYPDHILFSIPGMGKITVATIIGEIGDSVEKFPTQKDFIGYIGLYPTVFQSGKNSVYFRMTWKGNKWLKMAFILATVSARKNNPAFRNFYNRLRDRGKSKKAAGGALARKIASVVYAILRSGIPWNEEYALCGMRRGEQMSQRINEMAGSPNGVNPIRAQRLRDYVGPTRQRRI